MVQVSKNKAKFKSASPEAQILEAYLALCREIGAGSVTLQAVAKRSKVSFGKVHYYFGGKERGLAESAAAYVGLSAQNFAARELENALGRETELTRLGLYIDVTFRWAERLPDHASFWVYHYYLTSIESEFRRNHAFYLQKARARIASLLFESIGRKEIPEIPGLEKTDVEEALATRIHNALIGGVIAAITDPAPDSFARHRRATLETVDCLIRGAWHPEPKTRPGTAGQPRPDDPEGND